MGLATFTVTAGAAEIQAEMQRTSTGSSFNPGIDGDLGIDNGPDDQWVRTQDIVRLDLFLAVSDVDAQNLRATINLDPDLVIDDIYPPEVCLTSGVSPVSSLSDDKHDLVCNLGNVAEGSVVSIPLFVKVGIVAHGTPFVVSALVEQDAGASLVSNSVNFIATAIPQINVEAGNPAALGDPPSAIASVPVNSFGTANEDGYIVPVPIRVTGSADGIGAAPLSGNLSLRVDFSRYLRASGVFPLIHPALPGTRVVYQQLGDPAEILELPRTFLLHNGDLGGFGQGSGTGETGCGPNTARDYGLYGKPGILNWLTPLIPLVLPTVNPADVTGLADTNSSTPDSGSWVCALSRTNPSTPIGVNDTIDIAITAADWTTTPPPWGSSQNGAPVAISGLVLLFVPSAALPVGVSYSIDKTVDVSLISATEAIAPFNPVVETYFTDNSSRTNFNGTPGGNFTPYAGIVGGYSLMEFEDTNVYTNLSPGSVNRWAMPNIDGWGLPYGLPFLLPGDKSYYMQGNLYPYSSSGEARVQAGDRAALNGVMTGSPTSTPQNSMMCTQWDNSRARLTDGPATIPHYVLNIDGLVDKVLDGDFDVFLDMVSGQRALTPDLVYLVSSALEPSAMHGYSGPVWINGSDTSEGTGPGSNVPVGTVIEYGISSTITPGNQATWYDQSDLQTCNDADAVGGYWSVNPDDPAFDLDGPGGLTAREHVNSVRARTTAPFFQNYADRRMLQMDVWVEVLPNAGGSIVPMWFTYTDATQPGYPAVLGDPVALAPTDWTYHFHSVATALNCANNGLPPGCTAFETYGETYDPQGAGAGGLGWHRIGDRVILADRVASIDTTAAGPLAENIPRLRAGQVQTYDINLDTSGSGSFTGSQVSYTLPAGHTYVAGTATVSIDGGAATSIEPTAGPPGTIYWDFGTLPVGTTIDIELDVRTSTNPAESVPGASYSYAAQFHATNLDQAEPPSPSTLLNQAPLIIAVDLTSADVTEATTTPFVAVGDDVHFAMEYTNTGGSYISDMSQLSVFPFNGDSSIDVLFNRDAGSAFNGSIALDAYAVSVPGTLTMFTIAAPASISQDPFDPSNAAPGGSTVWCTEGPNAFGIPVFGDSGCPASLSEATAIHLRVGEAIAGPGAGVLPGDGFTVDLNFNVAGNQALDRYVANNGFQILSNPLEAYSNDAVVIVHSAGIGDFIWLDRNNNGIQDSGEPGIAGITVELLDDATGTVLATTLTDVNGWWSFTNLLAGTYRIRIPQPPAGYSLSPQDQGGDDLVDSDFAANGESGPIVLGASTVSTSVDGGYVPQGDGGILKSTSTPNLTVGSIASFSVQPTNTVIGGVTVPVRILDTMPVGFHAGSASGTGWSCVISSDGGVVDCAHPGSNDTSGTPALTIDAVVGDAAARNSVNTVTGGWVWGDTDPSNNTATAEVAVTRPSSGVSGTLAATGLGLLGLLIVGGGAIGLGALIRPKRRPIRA